MARMGDHHHYIVVSRENLIKDHRAIPSECVAHATAGSHNSRGCEKHANKREATMTVSTEYVSRFAVSLTSAGK